MIVSVVVCTYNRAELLGRTLQDLYQQDFDHSDYEIIVVDNNSSDHTKSKVEELSRSYVNLRYCLETQQGLCYARNRGWQEAQGAYVAYVDDDCQIPSEWLSVAEDIITQQAPSAFGGPFLPFYASPKPRWYHDSYASPYASATYRKEARLLASDEYLDGMNMVFRKSLLQNIGGFRTDISMMTRKKLGYGDETELFIRMRQEMPQASIYYDPRLFLYHLVRPCKMTLSWKVRSSFAMGRDCYKIFTWEQAATPVPYRQLFHQAFANLKHLGKVLAVSVLKRDRTRYPFWQNYVYEEGVEPLYDLGQLYQQGYRQYHQSSEPLVARVFRRLLHSVNKIAQRVLPGRLYHWGRHQYRHVCRRSSVSSPVNIVLGAGNTEFDGWISTDHQMLDITSERSWQRLFPTKSIDKLLCEHVLEHLSTAECVTALTACYRHLKQGGQIRIAVPDGYRRDAAYVTEVTPPKDGHQQLFTIDTLVPLLEEIGFHVTPLEYFDADGQFHHIPWDERDGHVFRSFRFDTQEAFRRGEMYYTSLIVDARKPDHTVFNHEG